MVARLGACRTAGSWPRIQSSRHRRACRGRDGPASCQPRGRRLIDSRLLVDIRAGPRARAHIRDRGVAPADIACVPAAAGGPKGLALLPLDRLLHAEWYARAPHIHFVGASIGAWRSAALAGPEPLAAIDRLEHAYVRGQTYRARPSPAEVGAVIRDVVRGMLDGHPFVARPGVGLDVLTTHARGTLAGGASRRAFARAALANTVSRVRLAARMERVAFHAGARSALDEPFDAFGWTRVALDARNAEDALVASGSIPIVCAPVRDIAGAPPGDYWDGGLIDYHLLLPYTRLPGLVLYPHFVPRVTPGWFDKHLPWRRHRRAHPWLDNVVVIAPSAAFIATLPNARLPERKDFYRYGADHAGRVRAWERAIGECGRFAEAAMQWLAAPVPEIVRAL